MRHRDRRDVGQALEGDVAEHGNVQELEDHTLDEVRIGVGQGFPVLENISPVAFVIQNFRAIHFAMRIDGKAVPGAAGITMASAKLEW